MQGSFYHLIAVARLIHRHISLETITYKDLIKILGSCLFVSASIKEQAALTNLLYKRLGHNKREGLASKLFLNH